MGLTLVTPPVVEPVTLEEAKAHLRVTHANEDTYITSLIVAATRHTEKIIGKSLMERTYRLTLDAFFDAIELPRGPVQSVTSVTYTDEAGETQTVPASEYTADTISNRQWIVRNSDATWPTPLSAVNVVAIEYVAGFDELPAEYVDLKHAIRIAVQRLYERHADPKNEDAMVNAIDALIQPYRAVLV